MEKTYRDHAFFPKKKYGHGPCFGGSMARTFLMVRDLFDELLPYFLGDGFGCPTHGNDRLTGALGSPANK